MENDTFARQINGGEGEMRSEHDPFGLELLNLVCPFYSPDSSGHLLRILLGVRRRWIPEEFELARPRAAIHLGKVYLGTIFRKGISGGKSPTLKLNDQVTSLPGSFPAGSYHFLF